MTSSLDAPVSWTLLSAHRVKVSYERTGPHVEAELAFDDAGLPIHFRSGDRSRASERRNADRAAVTMSPMLMRST